jgi:FixJ family two-component response regulator
MRSRKLVLVVDDDRSMLRAIERLLTVRGYAVEAFSTVNSFELKRQLTRAGASLPTIFITAQEDSATRQAASDAGCIAYLTKPFASQDLVDAIEGRARSYASDGGGQRGLAGTRGPSGFPNGFT